VAVVAKRFDVYLVALDPTVIVAPMTPRGRPYPTRVPCRFRGRSGRVVLDQIRTVDHTRLVRLLGRITRSAQENVLAMLQEMFAA